MSASGYTRQSTSFIASGQPVASTPVNNEFNQLQSAFSGTSGHDHSGGTGLGPNITLTAFGISGSTSGILVSTGNAGGVTTTTITGTSNQITVVNGSGAAGNPTLSIATGYVGQTSLTTLGTIGTGTWNGSVIGATYGGTGINNGSNTVTLGGNLNTASTFTTSGAFSLTLITTSATSITLPSTGTILSSANNLNDVGNKVTAVNNIMPSQTGNSGLFLSTNGSAISWANVTGASGGTVTSVRFAGDGTLLSSTPTAAVTSTGTLTATLSNAGGGTVLGNTTGTAAAPGYTPTPVLGINASTSGTLSLANGGAGGAQVKLQNTAATVGYNFNLPTGAGSVNQLLVSGGGGSTSMTWTTATYLSTTNINRILYSSANNTVAEITAAASSVLISSGSSVPSWSTTLPSGLSATSMTLTSPTITSATITSPTFTTPTLGVATATSLVFSPSTGGIIGTTTNNNASSGAVGEFVSSTILVGSAVSLTSAGAANITSISLTAGDWNVWGNVATNPASGTTTGLVQAWISTTSATIPTIPNAGAYVEIPYPGSPPDQPTATPAGQARVTLSGTTTVFLSTAVNFGVSTMTAYGFIGARRVR